MGALRDSRTLLSEVLSASELDVLQASLAIAADEYPALDPGEVVGSIERLSQEVREVLPPTTRLEPRLEALSHVLAGLHGYRGNASNYADPKNSYVNEVLTRKMGIPISLALVYQEVGKRAGIPLQGVAFPGHFLLAAKEGGQRLVVDAFGGGKVLNNEALRSLLGRSAPGVAFSPELLRPASPKQFIFRMLSNLKHVYLGAADYARALRIVELLLVVAPEHPGELRVRASVLQNLGAFQAALEDLQHCLALSPDAPDATVLRWTAQALASRAGRPN